MNRDRTRWERWAALVVAAQMLFYAGEKVYMAAIGRVGLPGMVGADSSAWGSGEVWLLQLGNAGLGVFAAGIVLATLRGWGPVARWVVLGALVLTLAAMAAGVVLLSVRGVWTGWVQLPLVVLVWPWLVWRFVVRYWRPVLPGAAWVALACAVPYGAMKLAWALGSDVLMAETPLGGADRELLLGDNPTALVVHILTVLIAGVGVLVILALATSWRERLPRWLLLGPAWLAVAFLFVRGVTGVSGALVTLFGTASAEARWYAGWDLGLWSPLWLVLGVALLRLVLRGPVRSPGAVVRS
ncbi:DUF3995 domain-containing protein [Crossiella sp. CA-258035]|uniref:DUF3995 domain-containing protein n=1 Tax=Crossiella sp. CA-258035 TaxID=2981138 RepID=UPI0024BCA6A5|nr:DUF3995 domain-containing protein [Crossiella sp. CA-258035]WHT20605.1 DUF3995 domain-containing protein [Crossiella sp. CA-258035]